MASRTVCSLQDPVRVSRAAWALAEHAADMLGFKLDVPRHLQDGKVQPIYLDMQVSAPHAHRQSH